MTDRSMYGDEADDRWDYEEPRPGMRGEFPWPPGEDDPVLSAFGETWKSSTFDPGAFFSRVPRDHGTGAALLYFLVVVVLVAGATLFWESLSLFTGGVEDNALAAELGIEAVSPIAGFLLTPAILLVTLCISAAISHVVLAVLGAARHGFGTTLRVFCYAYSPGLFGVVPILGGIVGSIWMVVLLIIGLREAQEDDGWKAAVAVLVPFAMLIGLMFVALMFVVAVGAAMTSGIG